MSLNDVFAAKGSAFTPTVEGESGEKLPLVVKLALWVVIGLAIHGLGYCQGRKSAQDRAIEATTRYAAEICGATMITTWRNATKLIEAKNRKPIVVECRP